MKIKCEFCGAIIEVPTYYARHREEILKKYQQDKLDPAFVEKRRKIALKCYHKKKNHL